MRVLICDGEPLVRAGLKASLREPDVQVVGEVDGGRPLLDEAGRIDPDVVLIGGGYSSGDSVDLPLSLPDAASEIHQPVAIVIEPNDHEFFLSCVRAGIRGFISKQTALLEVSDAVLCMARNRAYLSPALTLQHLNWFASRLTRDNGRASMPAGRLSPRESEVLEMLGGGLSNAEIANVLRIRETTVRSHVYHILTKLNLRNRTDAVLHGFQSNLHTH